MAFGRWQTRKERISRLKLLVQREVNQNRRDEMRATNLSKIRQQTLQRFATPRINRMASEPLGPRPSLRDQERIEYFQKNPDARMIDLWEGVDRDEHGRQLNEAIVAGLGSPLNPTGAPSFATPATQQIGSQAAMAPITPIVPETGFEPFDRNIRPFISPLGIYAGAVAPGAVLGGTAAATGLSLVGQEAERRGAPTNIAGTGIGTRSALELGGGVVGGGLEGAALRRGQRAIGAAGRTIEETGGLGAQPGRLLRGEQGGTQFGDEGLTPVNRELIPRTTNRVRTHRDAVLDIQDALKRYEPNPQRPLERIFPDGALIHIEPATDDGGNIALRLVSIRAPERGTGQGSSAIEEVKRLSAELNLPVIGKAKKFGKGGLSQKELTGFYRRHGFDVTDDGALRYTPPINDVSNAGDIPDVPGPLKEGDILKMKNGQRRRITGFIYDDQGRPLMAHTEPVTKTGEVPARSRAIQGGVSINPESGKPYGATIESAGLGEAVSGVPGQPPRDRARSFQAERRQAGLFRQETKIAERAAAKERAAQLRAARPFEREAKSVQREGWRGVLNAWEKPSKDLAREYEQSVSATATGRGAPPQGLQREGWEMDVNRAFDQWEAVAPDPAPVTVSRQNETLAQFQQQLDTAADNVDQSKQRLDQIKSLVKKGTLGPESAAAARKELQRNRAILREARKADKVARVRVNEEELVQDAINRGVAPERAELIRNQFRDVAEITPDSDTLLTAPAWRQHLAATENFVTGTAPGQTGQITVARNYLLKKIANHTRVNAYPLFQRVQNLIDSNLDSIRYTGPKENLSIMGSAGEDMSLHVVQHPEWFQMPDELRAAINQAQNYQRQSVNLANSLGYPIEALDQPYLEQLWEPMSGPLAKGGGANRIPGRVSVAKKKSFDDYITGMKEGFSPKQDYNAQHLMEHSANLVDSAIADAWMRQKILRTYGKKSTQTFKSGYRPFSGTPIYAGWNGPEAVTKWVEEFYNPPGTISRVTANAADRFRNTAFGLLDLAVTGVHFPLALAQGGVAEGFSALNRSLEMMNLPHVMMDFYGPEGRDRLTFWANNNLEITAGPSGVTPETGTLLEYGGRVGRTVDRKVMNKWVDFANNIQFRHGLTAIRLRAAEGGLLLQKLAGKDVTDPKVIQTAAEWANSMTGAGRMAGRASRKRVEGSLGTSPSLIRSQVEALEKVATWTFSPKATAEQRILGMTTLASFASFVYGIQYLFNQAIPAATGEQQDPMKFIPGEPGFGIIRLPGGKRISILPSRSLYGAMYNSIKGLAETDPAAVSEAWTKYTVGHLNPAIQGPVGLTGYGYDEFGRFHTGDLDTDDRLRGLAPLPPVGEEAVMGERDPVDLIGGGLGFNPYDVPAFELIQERWAQDKPDKTFSWDLFKAEAEGVDGKPPNEDYLALLQKFYAEGAARDTEGSQRREQATQARTEAEIESGIATMPDGTEGLAARFNAGEDVGEELVEAASKMQTNVAGRLAEIYRDAPGLEGENAEVFATIATLDPTSAKYRTLEGGAVDWDQWESDVADQVKLLNDVGKEEWETQLNTAIDEDWKKLAPQLKEAKEARDDLFDTPRYTGVSTNESREFGRFADTIERLHPQVMEALGYQVPESLVAIALGQEQGRLAFAQKYNRYTDAPLNPKYVAMLKKNRDILQPFFPSFYDSAKELAAIGAISPYKPGERPKPPSAPQKPSYDEVQRRGIIIEAIKRILPELIGAR